MTDQEQFDEGASQAGHQGELLVDLEGFEGPIDVLLNLAREQKVDLTRISILELADQYLAFIARVRRISLKLAADYLVMAAWLAYLKSRLLLPAPEGGEEPTGQQMADALAFQLRRLEAMQDAGARLMARPLLGREVFCRGAPPGVEVVATSVFTASLYELLKTYGEIRVRGSGGPLRIAPTEFYSVEQALERLRDLLGKAPGWESLSAFLPQGLKQGLVMRSAFAATFAASLELVREGRARMRQTSHFGPIYLRRVPERK